MALSNATGRVDDYRMYRAALVKAKASYMSQFFNHSTQDFGPTQTGNALGIMIDDREQKPGAIARLVESLRAHNGTHLTTGAVGSRWILQVSVSLVAVDSTIAPAYTA